MPKCELSVVSNQPLIDVFLVTQDNRPLLAVKALLDTGATGSCITASLVSKLQLCPIGKTKQATAGGLIEANRYAIHIGIPFSVGNGEVRVEKLARELEVSAIPDQSTFQMIIGIDLIQLGVLVVSGGKFIFSL